jgi:hypothetical protein
MFEHTPSRLGPEDTDVVFGMKSRENDQEQK